MKEVRKAAKNAWRTFCSSINDLPRSATLHRVFLRTLKLSWDLWWLLQVGIHGLKGKP